MLLYKRMSYHDPILRGFVSVTGGTDKRKMESVFKISIHVRKCWSGKRCHALNTWPSHDQTERYENRRELNWDQSLERKGGLFWAQINYWWHWEMKGHSQVNKRFGMIIYLVLFDICCGGENSGWILNETANEMEIILFYGSLEILERGPEWEFHSAFISHY